MTIDRARLRTVSAPLSYIAHDGGVVYLSEPAKTTVEFSVHDTPIADARPIADELDLEANGFLLVRHRTGVSADFGELAAGGSTLARYLEEQAALVREVTGAREAHAFGMLMRTERASDAAIERREDGSYEGIVGPATFAHSDFTEDGIRTRAQEDLGEEVAERLLGARRWKLVNVWRPLNRVESKPLAVCDGSTIGEELLVVKPYYEKPGETKVLFEQYFMKYSLAARWYYFPEMGPEEALVFKQYDNQSGAIRLCTHTAFDDPGATPGGAPRTSIECRVLAAYD
jgi:hypothetical protein